MMKKIMDFFTVNLVWKSVALMMAILLWFLGINITNPVSTKTIPVTLEIKNMDIVENNNYILLNREDLEKATVAVRVTTTTKNLSRISSQNVSAYIDLSPVLSFANKVGQELAVQVETQLPSMPGLTSQNAIVNPAYVNIVLDYKDTVDFNVNVKVTTDNTGGYIAQTATAAPSAVSITGARSLLETISGVVVAVDVVTDDITGDFVTTESVVVYDNNGKDITSQLELSNNEVQVVVPVKKQDQIPVQLPDIRGYVANGYTIADVILSERYIEVIGDEEDIAALNAIVLDPINVSGASQNVEAQRDVSQILREANLTVREGASSVVDVTVVIERLEVASFTVPAERLEIIGDSANAEYGGTVELNVMGTENALSELDPGAITGTVHIDGLEPGVYELDIEFILPEGIIQVGDPVKLNVIIHDGENPAVLPAQSTEPSELPESGADDGGGNDESPGTEPEGDTDNGEIIDGPF